jgi:periplasmic protein TonB
MMATTMSTPAAGPAAEHSQGAAPITTHAPSAIAVPPEPPPAALAAPQPIREARDGAGSGLGSGTGPQPRDEERDVEEAWAPGRLEGPGVQARGDRPAAAKEPAESGGGLGPGGRRAGGGEPSEPPRDDGHGPSARITPGSGEGPVAPSVEHDEYLRALRRHIHESLIYPTAARRRGVSGTVIVELIVKPTGDIDTVAVVRSSSHPALDEAALDAVRDVRPRPFPPGVPRRVLRVHLPIVFELR